MATSPDYSPVMLRSFLRIRVDHESRIALRAGPKAASEAARILRRAAKVSAEEWNQAWHGRLLAAAPRVRLWAALGVIPSETGVLLTDDGGQERVGS